MDRRAFTTPHGAGQSLSPRAQAARAKIVRKAAHALNGV
jgi:hypothetical protein